MNAGKHMVSRVVCGLIVALALTCVQVALFADTCCVQCSCVQLCCDAEVGCEGGGHCCTWCAECGQGCSFTCYEGGGGEYCCSDYCSHT